MKFTYTSFVSNGITAAVAQWVGALTLQAEDWMFESQPRQTSVEKQVMTALILNAQQKMRVSRVLGDDHYKRPVSQ